MSITDSKASILGSFSALLMIAVFAVWRILWSNVSQYLQYKPKKWPVKRCSFMFLSSEHIINRDMIFFYAWRSISYTILFICLSCFLLNGLTVAFSRYNAWLFCAFWPESLWRFNNFSPLGVCRYLRTLRHYSNNDITCDSYWQMQASFCFVIFFQRYLYFCLMSGQIKLCRVSRVLFFIVLVYSQKMQIVCFKAKKSIQTNIKTNEVCNLRMLDAHQITHQIYCKNSWKIFLPFTITCIK